MKRVHVKYATAALALFGLTSAAFGQYVWIDEKGVKQYSDMPPPRSVPPNRILKQPRGAAPVVNDESPAAPAAPNAKPPMTLAEKNADFQKRRAEQAEKEKKAEEEAKQAADKARNCERARAYKRTLESGERIANVDKNGERTFISDDQRSRDIAETKNILADCK